MEKLKYQRVYNYITNSDYNVISNLSVITNANYSQYLSTKKAYIDAIINSIIDNDIKLFNELIFKFDALYKTYKNHQIHQYKSFSLLREKILNYERQR